MNLIPENYFSPKADMEYVSASQIKRFRKCEAMALAEIKGEYIQEKSDSLLQGALCDVLLTGTEDEISEFYRTHPDIISSRGATKGELKSEFKKIIKMVERAKSDEFFMKTLNGDKQVIIIGIIADVPIKAKVDILGDKFITDLKTCENLHKVYWKNGNRVSFIENFDYVLQGAIYRELVRQKTGKSLPFFLACISKEDEPDIEIIQIDNKTLDEELEAIKDEIKVIKMIKDGDIEPTPCGKCAYCRMKKKLSSPISWSDLELE